MFEQILLHHPLLFVIVHLSFSVQLHGIATGQVPQIEPRSPLHYHIPCLLLAKKFGTYYLQNYSVAKSFLPYFSCHSSRSVFFPELLNFYHKLPTPILGSGVSSNVAMSSPSLPSSIISKETLYNVNLLFQNSDDPIALMMKPNFPSQNIFFSMIW